VRVCGLHFIYIVLCQIPSDKEKAERREERFYDFLFGTNGLEFFVWGAIGGFLFWGYITVTWYESQVNVMQCCRFFMTITHKCHFKNLCNKHEHIKFKLVKKCQTPMQ